MFMNFSLYLSLVISLAEPVSVLRNPLYRDRSPHPEAKMIGPAAEASNLDAKNDAKGRMRPPTNPINASDNNVKPLSDP
jgi:hypothetical protein